MQIIDIPDSKIIHPSINWAIIFSEQNKQIYRSF